MQMSKVDITGELRVTYSDTGVEQWDKQIDLFSTAKSKCLSAFHDLHWFQFPNGVYFGDNISDDVAIADVVIGTGDGASASPTLAALAPVPVKPNSVTITTEIASTTTTVTDDGAGALTGSGTESGTINYATGAITVTWDAAPDLDANVTADFTRGIATDDSLTTGFSFQLTDDVSPTLTDTAFTSTIPLTITPAVVDRYEQDNYVVYLVTMTSTYTGADTSAITGLGLVYSTVMGDGAGVTGADKLLAKSTTVNSNTIYDSSELILQNESLITVTYRIKVTK